MTIERISSIGHRSLALLTLGAVLAASAQAEKAAGFAQVRPEAVGISSARLQRLDSALQQFVDRKQMSGLVTLAARHGKVFHSKTYGMRDIASGSPMAEDTIFRIYSMTKPVTGVAMMILYEEGKWNPLDPISKHIPEFANLKVFKGVDPAGRMQLEDPAHAPTIAELMSHSAGFGSGGGDGPVDKLYKDEKGRGVLEGASLQEMIDRLAKIPLLYQPGSRWVYGVSVDIQGYLIEKLSGKPLPVFMKERIFDPLGMADTGFYVPKEKWNRFAGFYKRTESGEFVEVARDSVLVGLNFDQEPALPVGGGGLVSTAGDYLKFSQMLLNGGDLKGTRILAPPTVKLMSSNRMPESMMNEGPGTGIIKPGVGFGFDFGVFTDPGLAGNPAGRGTYYWGGYAGTWFWIDPTDDIVFVGMVQLHPDSSGGHNTWTLRELTQQLLYQALTEPKK